VMRRIIWRSVRRVAGRTELWNGNMERWRNLLTWDEQESVISWDWHHHPSTGSDMLPQPGIPCTPTSLSTASPPERMHASFLPPLVSRINALRNRLLGHPPYRRLTRQMTTLPVALNVTARVDPRFRIFPLQRLQGNVSPRWKSPGA
jgi:hypothetical protein